MARIRFSNFSRFFMERFGDFAVPILTECYSFLSHLMRSATNHQIGVMVFNNHRIIIFDYSNVHYFSSSCNDKSIDLLTSRRDIGTQMRSNSIKCSESKLSADRNSIEKTTTCSEVPKWNA